MAKCEAVAGTIVIDGEERTIACTLEEGHEKPYQRECSCGRHSVDWWSLGKRHQMGISWGTVDPLPPDPEKEALDV